MSDKYRIISRATDSFEVSGSRGVFTLKARGKLKLGKDLLVGDFVRVDFSSDEPVVAEVLARHNALIRPAVANVDLMVIVVAPQPQIDFLLVDKMLVNSRKEGIEAAICFNKHDLGDRAAEEKVLRQYGGEVEKIAFVSAKNGDVDRLREMMKGKLTCLAGQSAVGKSTVVNALVGGSRTVGELSNRIGRGRNTTTAAAILTSGEISVVDTPGFSMLDMTPDDAFSLALYYDEYVRLSDGCKFHPCAHTCEPDCAVRAAVERGELDRDRYDRYLRLFEEAKANSPASRRKG